MLTKNVKFKHSVQHQWELKNHAFGWRIFVTTVLKFIQLLSIIGTYLITFVFVHPALRLLSQDSATLHCFHWRALNVCFQTVCYLTQGHKFLCSSGLEFTQEFARVH